jgi:hypothetical protein
MLRRAPQDFKADTWHAVKVGALIMCFCVLIVAVLYAAPEGHDAAKGLMG